MPTSLEMKNIQKFYGPIHVVKDFDLHIQPGEFVTFLGPSGSGKTTALKMIAGFETPTSGDIFLGSRSVVDLPAYERGIGMVFQNYALFPHMTVAENVVFPLTVRKVPRQQAEEKVSRALRLVKMDQYSGRYPNQLSGGQQQRIALARAIVFNPSILLMDEPLGALDRNLREHMKIEIMRIQKELNVTVLFVTHDQDEALTMSDRIAVINEGRLVQVDDSRSLYAKPKNRFVASFVGESNMIPCRVDRVEEDSGKVTVAGIAPGTAQLSGQTDGANGWLFVRPEHVEIGLRSAAVNLPNAIDGVVENALFLGEMTRYMVRCGDEIITVKRQNRGEVHFAGGTPVTVSWKTEDCTVLN
ncbi:ABC transporter ATP-binding protein [Sinorhizobium meliloti]|uniref:ABC transporter ATP-binding protein n=1 Tax=Rhizobium meliloti TaxID=382 RepID=UPI0001E4B60C|nr:ABC transporter ATP-binding protein [Sinorhizobium meliloti]AEG57888.1 spermidine/putrescine ABC transporter ATPase subunit [Sinorhizobium meliloti AK83]MDE4587342.1 ABC transporter ATP-binding protein [Sinorhizobium meliloti]RVG95655.1 ABC transporter ATP-binding protein [Sinorhizobium meliloti]SEJ82724.1 putative spermidine/putrescine transport system ATP-binding protein [Sinorhizobium meliloti]